MVLLVALARICVLALRYYGVPAAFLWAVVRRAPAGTAKLIRTPPGAGMLLCPGRRARDRELHPAADHRMAGYLGPRPGLLGLEPAAAPRTRAAPPAPAAAQRGAGVPAVTPGGAASGHARAPQSSGYRTGAGKLLEHHRLAHQSDGFLSGSAARRRVEAAVRDPSRWGRGAGGAARPHPPAGRISWSRSLAIARAGLPARHYLYDVADGRRLLGRAKHARPLTGGTAPRGRAVWTKDECRFVC